MTSQPQRWLILATYFGLNSRWIDDFYVGSDIKFEKAIPRTHPTSWHVRGPTTPLKEWVDLWTYAYEGVRSKPDGIITSFPPLSLATAAWLKTLGSSTKLIAWTFNTSAHAKAWKGFAAGQVLRRVDQFVVHSTYEIDEYARWLRLPRSKFTFVPLQRGEVDRENKSPIQEPYVLAMGSAHRDYETLVQAVRGTGMKTVIVAAADIAAKLTRCAEVTTMSGLTEQQCLDLLSGARVNVTPMQTQYDVAGQVTFLTALRMGIPQVATRCAGNADYLEHGKNALIVAPQDVAAMRESIRRLWNDEAERAALSAAGLEAGATTYSDEAAGEALGRVVEKVWTRSPSPTGSPEMARARANDSSVI